MTASATATATQTSGGGGGGTTTTANGVTTVAPGVTTQTFTTSIDPTTLTGTVTNVSNVPVTAAAGATITDGNFAVSLPAGFTTAANVTVSITISPQSVTGLAGNVAASPNGTVVDIVITDASTGQPITSVNTPITVTVKPSAADLAMAGGDTSKLAAIYIVAPNTSSVFNPLGLPAGSALFVSGFSYNASTGLASWNTQNTAGIVQAIVANPVSYVQTVNPGAQEYSSFDPNASQSFGGKPQFSYLQVVSPQIPVDNRLVVLDPDTGNYSYVNATDVAPSGPPPAKSSSAVVRGLVRS